MSPVAAPVVPVPAPVDPAELARERERAARALEEETRVAREAEARRAAEAEREAFLLAFPLHGVAFHFLAPIRNAPRDRATTVGYLRRGAAFRASDRIDGAGCERGYHRLPGDGYVCRGDGVLVGSEPQRFEPSPHPPSLEEPMPYTYAYTSRKSVAQFVRIPTVEEEAVVPPLFARLEAEESAPDGGVPVDAGVAAETSEEVEAPPPPGSAPEDAGVPEDGLPSFLRMRMLRGFYVSVDAAEDTDDGRRFVRTVRGGYVRNELLTPNEPPTRQGVVLGAGTELPVAFVFRNGAHKFRVVPDTGEMVDDGPVEQHAALAVRGRRTRGSATYLLGADGWAVRSTAARVAELAPRPAAVPVGAKWIHVDLSEQVLVAYEGDRAVFTTTVSTGREGFATPTGIFRIQSKHVTTTMDDLSAGDEAYSIEDVPWTMYFDGNFALHGAFWHNQFGRVRSHGCVNLAPYDARYLFMWSTPTLPPSWHGVFSTRENGGTYVVVVP